MAQNNDKKVNDLVDPAQGATTWKERYSLASSNQTKMFKRFADYYDALYAQVDRTPAPWRSKVYIPKLAQQTWTLVSKFLSINPGFVAEVRDTDFEDEKIQEMAEKAQRKLEYDYDNHLFEESARDKLFASLLDAVVTGTGLAKVPWTVENRKVFTRLKNADQIDLSKHQIKTIKEGYNNLIPVNIFNVFVSPAAAAGTGSLYKLPWLIIKEYKPISELEKVNQVEGAVIYKNLDQLNGKVTYDTFAQYNRSRDRLLTNTDPQDKTVRMVEIFECYEGDMITTYANSGSAEKNEAWIELRKQQNPYWHGKYPLVKFHVKKRAFNFWGEGIFDITYRLQAAYNDAVNHYFDAWNTAVDPMLITPESANVDDYVIEPAGMITYSGQVAPQPFKMHEPNPAMLEAATSLLDQAIEGVTISQYAAGLPSDETDKTKGTAAGIENLQTAAGDTVSFKRANFMQSLVQIGRMWHSNNQQFMLRDLSLTINTPRGPEKTTIKPADLQGDFNITIDPASMDPLTPQQKIQNYESFTAQLTTLQNQSFEQNKTVGTPPLALDFNAIADNMSEQFDMRNFNKLLVPQEQLEELHEQQMQQAMQHVQGAQQAQAEAEQQKAAASQQPPKSLAESLQIKFTDLPSDVQHDVIQQVFGIDAQEPTPSQQGNMLKAMDSVTKAAQTGHGIQQDHFNAAHDVIKHASDMHQQNVANAMQMTGAAQMANNPDNAQEEGAENENG